MDTNLLLVLIVALALLLLSSRPSEPPDPIYVLVTPPAIPQQPGCLPVLLLAGVVIMVVAVLGA